MPAGAAAGAARTSAMNRPNCTRCSAGQRRSSQDRLLRLWTVPSRQTCRSVEGGSCALKRQNGPHKPRNGTLARNSVTTDLVARADGREVAAKRAAVVRDDDLARDDLDALAAPQHRV